MKDFTTIKFLITELEEVNQSLNTRLTRYQEDLNDDSDRLSKFKVITGDTNNRTYIYTDENGIECESNSWDYEYAVEHVTNDKARINAVKIIMETLSSIDLNKVSKKAGDK